VPMREECKHFQSRTYASGEVARFCVLDLAPEAPWRCPEDCPRYEPRRADVGWAHGSLVPPAVEDEPDEPAGDVASLLEEAEDVVNAVVPEVLQEVESERERSSISPWRRALRRLGRRGSTSPFDEGEGFGGSRGAR
jgi:hypothetical protein